MNFSFQHGLPTECVKTQPPVTTYFAGPGGRGTDESAAVPPAGKTGRGCFRSGNAAPQAAPLPRERGAPGPGTSGLPSLEGTRCQLRESSAPSQQNAGQPREGAYTAPRAAAHPPRTAPAARSPPGGNGSASPAQGLRLSALLLQQAVGQLWRQLTSLRPPWRRNAASWSCATTARIESAL